MVAYVLINRAVQAVVRPILDPFVKGQDDPVVKERYLHKSCESSGKLVVYSIQFFWGLKTLYNTDWVPPFLLGNGAFENTIKDMPFTPCPPEIHLLCLSFLAMFCSYEFDHCQQTDRPDWNEMFAHHICSIALTFGMIFANNRALGVVIAWQQTFCDIPVQISRITASMPFVWPMLSSYAVLMTLWFWTRIYNFGMFTFRVATEMKYGPGLEHFNVHVNIYSVFLVVLFLLQLYWTVLLI